MHPAMVEETRSSAKLFREDLFFLRDVFSRLDKSFSQIALKSFHLLVEELVETGEEHTFAKFAMGVARCLARADNAHTMAILWHHLPVLPLRLHWFSDGLYVIRTLGGPADIVGARILQIAGKPPEMWLTGLGEYVGGNASRLRTLSPFFLVCPDALACIDPAVMPDRLTLDYLPHAGEKATCTLMTGSLDRNLLMFPNRDPGISVLDVDGDKWRQALDRAEVPLYLKDFDKNVIEKWFPRERAIYIGFRRTMDGDGFHLVDYLNNVVETVKQREGVHAIIDLRFNEGGDYLLARKFCETLPTLIPPSGRLFIITNGQTFSAGLIIAAMLKFYGGSRSSIIGEGVGDRSVFWAEGGVMDLPGTGLPVRCATQFHDWETGCRDPELCPWFNVLYSVAAGSLEPDKKVETAGSQYLGGQDPVIDAIFQELAVYLADI